jgi:plastocyanin
MRERLVLPILIPIAAAGVIFLLIFSASRILLAMDPQYAVPTALIIALGILGVSALLAVGPPISRTLLYLLTAVPASVVIAVGLYLAVRPSEEAAAGSGGPAPVTTVVMTATDNKFSLTEITVPVNTEITFTLDNKGQALHNWHVLNAKDKDGKDIATTLLAGGKSETIKFTIAQTGTFDFQCDVHPIEMRGKLTVVAAAPATAGAPAAGAGPAPGGAAPAGGTVIVATDNKFDKTQITVKANEPVTLTLQNKGSAIHNWHVLNVKDKDGKDITTNLLPGGQSQTITFVITQTGTFDYLCDVHPVEMRGKLTVQ